MTNRIEFYKNRSIGERFSVAIDFLKQNWKVLYKNILLGGLPLAIMMGYFLARQISTQTLGDLSVFFLYYGSFIFLSIINLIYIYSMTGAVLDKYERNQLTETTGWNDLSNSFFRFAGKTFNIMLIVYIPLILIFCAIALLFGFSATAFASNTTQSSILLFMLIIFFIIGAAIAFSPSLSVLFFPSYFSDKGIIESVKTSFSLGFKNWGSLMVAIILTAIVIMLLSLVFTLPFQIISMFSMFGGREFSMISFILATLSTIGTLLTTPIMIIIFAFQYFSIVEKEEGVSLQSKFEEFEKL